MKNGEVEVAVLMAMGNETDQEKREVLEVNGDDNRIREERTNGGRWIAAERAEEKSNSYCKWIVGSDTDSLDNTEQHRKADKTEVKRPSSLAATRQVVTIWTITTN